MSGSDLNNRSAMALAQAAARGEPLPPAVEGLEHEHVPSRAELLAAEAAGEGRTTGVRDAAAAFVRDAPVVRTGAALEAPAVAVLRAYEHFLRFPGLTAVGALGDGRRTLRTAVSLSDMRRRAPARTALDEADETHARRSERAIDSAGALGALVRASREARGLSQQKFAAFAGLGRRFVSELENGKATLEFDKVARAARAAGIELIARVRL
jgi:y4mF family transcriptional regulator